MLRLAARLGCAGIDTARSYGGSEAAIGRARRAGAGHQLPVVTKIRPLAGHDDAAGVAAAVRASLAESLGHLGAERVPAVLLHRAGDLTEADGAAVAALRAARADGLVTAWGVSVSDPGELLASLAIGDLGYVQLPFSLVDRRWLGAGVQDALAARPDVTIAARSVFLQGILLHPDESTWPAGTEPSASAVASGLNRLAGETGRAVSGLCLGYALAQPWIDYLVVGVRSADQLAGIAAQCAGPPLTAEECARIMNAIPAGSPALVNPALWPGRRKD